MSSKHTDPCSFYGGYGRCALCTTSITPLESSRKSHQNLGGSVDDLGQPSWTLARRAGHSKPLHHRGIRLGNIWCLACLIQHTSICALLFWLPMPCGDLFLCRHVLFDRRFLSPSVLMGIASCLNYDDLDPMMLRHNMVGIFSIAMPSISVYPDALDS